MESLDIVSGSNSCNYTRKRTLYEKLRRWANMAFNIESISIRYEEMNVPLYSGLAFQIYLVSINAYPIGCGVDAQAE